MDGTGDTVIDTGEHGTDMGVVEPRTRTTSSVAVDSECSGASRPLHATGTGTVDAAIESEAHNAATVDPGGNPAGVTADAKETGARREIASALVLLALLQLDGTGGCCCARP